MIDKIEKQHLSPANKETTLLIFLFAHGIHLAEILSVEIARSHD